MNCLALARFCSASHSLHSSGLESAVGTGSCCEESAPKAKRYRVRSGQRNLGAHAPRSDRLETEASSCRCHGLCATQTTGGSCSIARVRVTASAAKSRCTWRGMPLDRVWRESDPSITADITRPFSTPSPRLERLRNEDDAVDAPSSRLTESYLFVSTYGPPYFVAIGIFFTTPVRGRIVRDRFNRISNITIRQPPGGGKYSIVSS
jgi:hypothetical protein